MKKGKQVYIPEKQLQEIESWAKRHGETVPEMIHHLVEAQLEKIRGREVFYPGLKWAMPEETFIEAAMQQQDFKRLHDWLCNRDTIEIITNDKNGTIHLINVTLTDKLAAKRNKHKVAPTII
ncbi:MAG TPA: hypothetical protein VLV84_04080 [Candidatus Acidoferrales bacterium]|nr:hypothetical protein [Candidatus Acidoferrales bacterium]